MLLVISVRAHYTIDVWGGLIVSVLLFQLMDIQVKYKDGCFANLEKIEPNNRNNINDGDLNQSVTANGNVVQNVNATDPNTSSLSAKRFKYYLF